MDEQRIEELLVQWDDQQAQGRDVSAEELCQDSPELVDELRVRIRTLKATSWLDKSPSEFIPKPSSANIAPKSVGKYELTELVGVGGFGEVWKAFDPDLQRVVAIKIPRRERLSTLGQTGQFVDEARKVAQLPRHPGIVPVYDVGRDGNSVYIVSDFIDGGNLADRMKQQPLDVQSSLRLVAAVADSLYHAHRHQVIHRDIKPANILLGKDDQPFLSDFGIAVKEDDAVWQRATTTGTLAYMSPEQVDGQAVNHQTDIYGLGVVLYELLTGRVPFVGRSPMDVREAISAGIAKPPRAVNEQIPKEVNRICLQAMARHPGDRYSTAKDFADELRSVLDAGKKGRWPLVLGGFIVLLALMGLVGRWLWTAWSDAHQTMARIDKQNQAMQKETASILAEASPENTIRDVALHRGHVLFDKQRFNEALAAYSEAIQADPTSAEAFHRRGTCQYNLGNIKEAISDYDEAIRLSPKNAEAYKNRALANLRIGQFDAAIADAEQGFGFDATAGREYRAAVALAHSHRGTQHDHDGQRLEAVDDFTKAIEYESDNAALFDQRGSAYFNLNRLEEAIADFSRAIELDGTNAQFREHRNYAYAAQAKAKQAEADGEATRP